MTCPLEMHESHDLYQVTNMKGICGWVETNITGGDLFLQLLLSPWHHIVDHAPPAQFFNKILHPFNLRPKDKKLAFLGLKNAFSFSEIKKGLAAPFYLVLKNLNFSQAHGFDFNIFVWCRMPFKLLDNFENVIINGYRIGSVDNHF